MIIKSFKQTLDEYVAQEQMLLLENQTTISDYIKNFEWVEERRQYFFQNGPTILKYIDYLIEFFFQVDDNESLENIPSYSSDEITKFIKIRDRALKGIAIYTVYREVVTRPTTFEYQREQGENLVSQVGEEIVKSLEELHEAATLLSVHEKLSQVDFTLLEPYDDLFYQHNKLYNSN
ncbi:MAG: hypothetical protein AABX29_05880 [Nanoarchaeota archaeon]